MYAIKDQNGRWFTGFRFRAISELERKNGIPVFNAKTVPDFSTDSMMLLKLEEAKKSMEDLAKYGSITCEIMEIVPISVPIEV